MAVPHKPPSALRHPGFRWFFATYAIAMMADNIEHVISYWVAYDAFHSAALAGFAVISHWVPFLVFSVWVGALNDRFDSRRVIQCGQALFILASVDWGIIFATDSLQIWGAVLLLTLHGCAGVLWQTSSQMLLYDIVGPDLLPSAVRLNATARYLGVLVGPVVGGAIMLVFGPTRGIFVNTVFYLPIVLWLTWAPYGRHFRGTAPPPRRAVRGLADIVQTVRDVRGVPVLGAMLVLAGSASFLVGNSYQALMPKFAIDLGHGNTGVTYFMLLAADAAGALTGGLLLETSRGWLRITPRNAITLSLVWAVSLAAFGLVRYYPACLAFLFCAGFFELSFGSMAQTIVQMKAPNDIRGRVLGLYNMSALGLRAFSGITVGLVGSLVTIHISLALATGCFTLAMLVLLVRLRALA
ncbi:MAG: MFS transporter [Deltaproteobacteria bacterium]|nr:MAG: MFS transporter [Deltaproteobacteria bacterium]